MPSLDHAWTTRPRLPAPGVLVAGLVAVVVARLGAGVVGSATDGSSARARTSARSPDVVDGDTIDVDIAGRHRARPPDRHRHARDPQADTRRSVLRPEASAYTADAARRPARRCASSATSTAATTTAGCSPTSTALDDGCSSTSTSSPAGLRHAADDPAQHRLAGATSPPPRRGAERSDVGLWAPVPDSRAAWRRERGVTPLTARRTARLPRRRPRSSSCPATTSARATPPTSACTRRCARASATCAIADGAGALGARRRGQRTAERRRRRAPHAQRRVRPSTGGDRSPTRPSLLSATAASRARSTTCGTTPTSTRCAASCAPRSSGHCVGLRRHPPRAAPAAITLRPEFFDVYLDLAVEFAPARAPAVDDHRRAGRVPVPQARRRRGRRLPRPLRPRLARRQPRPRHADARQPASRASPRSTSSRRSTRRRSGLSRPPPRRGSTTSPSPSTRRCRRSSTPRAPSTIGYRELRDAMRAG